MVKQPSYKRLTFVIEPGTLRCLRLYAVSQSMSHTAILRSITKNWLRQNCMTEEVLKSTIFDQFTEEWTRCRFIDPEASLEDFGNELKKKVGKRFSVEETTEIIEEWKSKMKP